MTAFDDLLTQLQQHRDHCADEMVRTTVEASPSVANKAAWREEVQTIDLIISALEQIRDTINGLIAWGNTQDLPTPPDVPEVL